MGEEEVGRGGLGGRVGLFEEVKKEILGDGKEIFDDIDRLTLRYQNLMAEKYEELAQRLKKKSMLGSERSCRH